MSEDKLIQNSSLKEYYININKLYNNAVNILTAINQSFHSSASEINVTYTDTDDLTQTIRIPSFLYLENKIEELDSNFDNLFNIPKSGEAWFNKTDDMYKLELVKSNCASVKPEVNTDNILAYVKDTNIFRDLVNPKTYLKVDISNLPDNIEKMVVKKIIIYNSSIYESLKSANLTSYDEYKSMLYNLVKGIDYDEYDSVIDLPIKEDKYISNFQILEVDNDYNEGNKRYKIKVDKITYSKEDDSSVEFTLQKDQKLCITDEYAIYKIVDINIQQSLDGVASNELILEEVNGHMTLQTFEENQNMVLHLYNKDYSNYHYIELPLEENQYVAFFLSTLYNNVKSSLSQPILLNLAEIPMVDKDGNKIINDGKEISYLQYYNKYCQNIGDMILGFSNVAYTQVSNYSFGELQELQNGDVIQKYVTDTIVMDNLKVQRINTHLIDDEYSTKIINLHSKRNELSTNVDNIQSNIDSVYNQLVNTNFETDNTTSQMSLKSKLNDLYNEKIITQKQLISVIDNINILKTNVYGTAKAKFRVRGNADIEKIESHLNEFYYKCNVIQMEVQYKYKSIGKDTTDVSNINSNLFTDWNKLETIERERKLVFDNDTNSYHLEYENYDDITNIIKWNQIEIPITQGEDVILRVRYKYSIGQPFLNLYTPWSDEFTVIFPQEFTDTLELSAIVTQNDDDVVGARFLKTLINDGYSEHVNNKIIDNSQVFYHMPENIYSGFNTSENTFISLKDKLQSICNDLDEYKDIIQSDRDSAYSLYLTGDNYSTLLFPNKTNELTISESEAHDTFITKNLKLMIKNTGNIPLKLYSIFPGKSDNYLIQMDNNMEQIYNSNIYENVPILIEGESYKGQTAFETANYQSFGQFIYFRKKSTYNINSYYTDEYKTLINFHNALIKYYNSEESNNINYIASLMNNIYNDKDSEDTAINNFTNYINYIKTSKQLCLTPRYRYTTNETTIKNVVNSIGYINLDYTPNTDGNGHGDYNDITFAKNLNNDNEENQKNENKPDFYSWSNNVLSQFDFINNIRKYKTYIYKEKDNDTDEQKAQEQEKCEKNKQLILSNKFVFRYEHIHGINKSENSADNLFQLTDQYSLSSLLNNSTRYEFKKSTNDKLTIEDLYGGFLIPALATQNQIMCTDNNNSSITINVGESISIPILLQYYLNDDNNEITKTLSFDIKKSLFKPVENYTIQIKAKYNYSQSASFYNDANNFIIDSVENSHKFIINYY